MAIDPTQKRAKTAASEAGADLVSQIWPDLPAADAAVDTSVWDGVVPEPIDPPQAER